MSIANLSRIGRGVLLFAIGSEGLSADDLSQKAPVLVYANGSVSAIGPGPGKVGFEERVKDVYEFGLPGDPPVRRWLEDDALPICHTAWDQNGIRYTQTVLMTRLEAGELVSRSASDSVLLVQIKGENLTSEYAEGSAAFAAQRAGQVLNLELRDGSIYVTGAGQAPPLGMVDIAPAGIASTNGSRLLFRGNLPPMNSGTMIIKIPTTRSKDHAEIDRLRDLDFEEEFRRVKRFWADRAKAGRLQPVPVEFSKTAKAVRNGQSL